MENSHDDSIVSKKTKREEISLLAVFFILVAILGLYFVWRNYSEALIKFLEPRKVDETLTIEQPASTTGKISPTPQLTPRPILQGKETYSIGQSANARPKIRSVEVDPHDPKINDMQSLKVRVVDAQPVQSVKVTIGSDNKTRAFDLKLTEGTNLDGKWTLSWKVDDTVLYSYYFTVDAVGTGSRSNITVSIR